MQLLIHIPKLQRWIHWRLGMYKQFYPTLYWACLTNCSHRVGTSKLKWSRIRYLDPDLRAPKYSQVKISYDIILCFIGKGFPGMRWSSMCKVYTLYPKKYAPWYNPVPIILNGMGYFHLYLKIKNIKIHTVYIILGCIVFESTLWHGTVLINYMPVRQWIYVAKRPVRVNKKQTPDLSSRTTPSLWNTASDKLKRIPENIVQWISKSIYFSHKFVTCNMDEEITRCIRAKLKRI